MQKYIRSCRLLGTISLLSFATSLLPSRAAASPVTPAGSPDASPASFDTPAWLQTTDLIRQRGIVSTGNMDRLIWVMQKATRGEEITIAAIGGSITAGGVQTKNPAAQYVAQIAAWFTKNYPKAKVKFVNAGIGGTNSIYGALRVKTDVLEKNPDLVIVECAVNNKAGWIYSDSCEGLIRQILADPRGIAVIELFFMHAEGESEQQWLEIVGRHYDLPMVSFRDAWWPEIMAGRAFWADMYADNVHPNDKGHTLATDLLVSLLQKAQQKALSGGALIQSTLSEPMISDTYTRCTLMQGQGLNPVANSGWVRSANGRSWESGAGDTSIEFETSGTVLFAGFELDKTTELLTTFSIDDAAPKPLKFDANRPPLATNLPPGKHRLRIHYAGSKAHAATSSSPSTQGATPSVTPSPAPAGQPPRKLSVWGVGSAGN